MILNVLIIVTGILLTEWILWKLYYRKMLGLTLPHRMDESFFRFFTITRMRFIAVSHAITLICIITLLLLFLW